MTFLYFREFKNQYLMFYTIERQNGIVKADLNKGFDALLKLSKIHFRRHSGQFVSCTVEKSEWFNPEFDHLKNVVEAWGVEGVRLREKEDYFKITGKNGDAVFAIAQTMIEMLNELNL